jgi:hypothetical protein
MIMAVLFLPVLFFDREIILSRDLFPRNSSRRKKLLPQNKKPTRLRVGRNFFFIALITNSPLVPYLGGTQNRNQYE